MERLGAAGRSGFSDLRKIALLYADDMTLTLSHGDPQVLAQAANVEARVGDERLAKLDLPLGHSKSTNIVFSPNNYVGGLFRRLSTQTTNGNFGRNNNLLLIRGRMATVPIHGGGGWSPAQLEAIFGNLPFRVADELRGLGITFD